MQTEKSVPIVEVRLKDNSDLMQTDVTTGTNRYPTVTHTPSLPHYQQSQPMNSTVVNTYGTSNGQSV